MCAETRHVFLSLTLARQWCATWSAAVTRLWSDPPWRCVRTAGVLLLRGLTMCAGQVLRVMATDSVLSEELRRYNFVTRVIATLEHQHADIKVTCAVFLAQLGACKRGVCSQFWRSLMSVCSAVCLCVRVCSQRHAISRHHCTAEGLSRTRASREQRGRAGPVGRTGGAACVAGCRIERVGLCARQRVRYFVSHTAWPAQGRVAKGPGPSYGCAASGRRQSHCGH